MNINNEIYGDRSTWVVKKHDKSKTIYTMPNKITAPTLDRTKTPDRPIRSVAPQYESYSGTPRKRLNRPTLQV